MRQKIDKNYYELLDVTAVSTIDDIEEAYSQAMSLYGGDSDAVYSLYSMNEKESIVEMIKAAYETLRDPVKRREYDLMMLRKREDEDPPEVDINELGSDGREIFRSPAGSVHNTVSLKRPLFLENADPAVTEEYRVLCAKLEEISHRNHYKAFAVTSSVKDEGKSTMCFNLSYILATEFRKKTVLVECDLRKGSTVARNLETFGGSSGLAAVLKGEKDIYDAVSRVKETSLHVLTSGDVSDKSFALLDSTRLKDVINTLKAEFDFVIVDCPPVLPVADMNIISKAVDGLILVVRAGKTPRDIVIKTLKSISGANTIGLILNGVDTKLKRYYYY